MSQSNPFLSSMVRLQAVPGTGKTISLSGHTFDLDKDGCIEVPAHLAPQIEPHGFHRVPPKAEKAAA